MDRFSPAQEPDHDVEAQRHQLQADEQRHQVGTGGEEKHAALGQQHQAVVFAMMLTLDLEVAVRDQQHDERRQIRKIQLNSKREAVDGEGAAGTR